MWKYATLSDLKGRGTENVEACSLIILNGYSVSAFTTQDVVIPHMLSLCYRFGGKNRLPKKWRAGCRKSQIKRISL